MNLGVSGTGGFLAATVHLVGPPGGGGGHDDSFALKGDGTSDRTIVIRDRGGTHGSKDPNRAGPTSLHEVSYHVEGKAALFKQFGDAEGRPVVLDTRDPDPIVEICPWRNYTALA